MLQVCASERGGFCARGYCTQRTKLFAQMGAYGRELAQRERTRLIASAYRKRTHCCHEAADKIAGHLVILDGADEVRIVQLRASEDFKDLRMQTNPNFHSRSEIESGIYSEIVGIPELTFS